jgi:hypothetical protein
MRKRPKSTTDTRGDEKVFEHANRAAQDLHSDAIQLDIYMVEGGLSSGIGQNVM